MRTFVDTSALYVLLDDDNHASTARWFSGPGTSTSELLITQSYVVVESVALVRHRLEAAGVRDLLDGLLPVRDAGLDRAFAFDRDFTTEGIPVVP